MELKKSQEEKHQEELLRAELEKKEKHQLRQEAYEKLQKDLEAQRLIEEKEMHAKTRKGNSSKLRKKSCERKESKRAQQLLFVQKQGLEHRNDRNAEESKREG